MRNLRGKIQGNGGVGKCQIHMESTIIKASKIVLVRPERIIEWIINYKHVMIS